MQRVLVCLLLAAVLAAAQTAPSTGPAYLGVLNTDGCPDWRPLLSRAASGGGVSSSDVILWAYLGCLVRDDEHQGQLQFYVVNDPNGDKGTCNVPLIEELSY